jgi:molybdopterin-guanine dinucleotide biosynthesis protein A
VSAPLQGLILAGGLSARMQRDKAALTYLGKSQLDRVFELASRHLSKVFISVRADQTADPARADKPQIVDSVAGGGPIVGIRSAFAQHPEAAWLVLACDLPFLTDSALAHLLAARDPLRIATAYRSTHDGLPEPLCAIWEPAAAQSLAAHQAAGRTCPRKFLINSDTKLVEPVEPRALDNINTPEEYIEAGRALDAASGPHTMQLKIQYYALLREQAGRSEETWETTAATPAAVYAELNARYRFTLAREQLRVAVNSEFSDWTRALHTGDALVFIPPVAGG